MDKMTPRMNRERIIDRLGSQEKPGTDATTGLRGDHDLNPGLYSTTPLKPAAVLIGLVEHASGTNVLFTLRTDHLDHHPGQVSFPGGHTEPHDASPEAAAIRETEEETGLHRRHIQVIGRLDDYDTRTGFRITPIVAMITPPFELSPDPFEVAEIFEVPLDFLLDPNNHQRHSRMFEGTEREFYAMPYGDYYIWGATAGMLVNLYQALKT